jgi:hypothetical protein
MAENNKINVAELLRNCPKGMELDCIMYENCRLVGVEETVLYPIKIICAGITIKLTKEGGYSLSELAKCVIFPKGKEILVRE